MKFRLKLIKIPYKSKIICLGLRNDYLKLMSRTTNSWVRLSFSGCVLWKTWVVPILKSQLGFRRHSSIDFSLGMVRDIVQPVIATQQQVNEQHSYRTYCGKVVANFISNNVPSKNFWKDWYFSENTWKCVSMATSYHGELSIFWSVYDPNITPLASFVFPQCLPPLSQVKTESTVFVCTWVSARDVEAIDRFHFGGWDNY